MLNVESWILNCSINFKKVAGFKIQDLRCWILNCSINFKKVAGLKIQDSQCWILNLELFNSFQEGGRIQDSRFKMFNVESWILNCSINLKKVTGFKIQDVESWLLESWTVNLEYSNAEGCRKDESVVLLSSLEWQAAHFTFTPERGPSSSYATVCPYVNQEHTPSQAVCPQRPSGAASQPLGFCCCGVSRRNNCS